jgi:hypothetical protein
MYVLRIYMGNPMYSELLQAFKQKQIMLSNYGGWGDSSDITKPMTFSESQKLRDSFPAELRKYISVYSKN